MPFRLPQRVLGILWVLLKYCFRRQALMPDGKKVKINGPKRLLLVFEELGGVFFKFGQILSMRFDILPVEYALELVNLLDNSQPVENEKMFKVFEEGLGMSIRDVFLLQEAPIATASFAQVYQGRYQGRDVIIKLQKPDARRFIETDLLIFSFLTEITDGLSMIRAVSMREIIFQLRDWLTEELDYRLEADNTKIIGNHVHRHRIEERIVVPQVYDEFTRERVLVEEFLPGIQVTSLMNHSSVEYQLLLSHLESVGTNIDVVAELFVRDLMRQYFIDGFFQADPHPGNLMIFPKNIFGHIDFGIIGRPVHPTHNFLRFIDGATTLNFGEMAGGLVDFANEYLERELGRTLHNPKFKKLVKTTFDFISERLAVDLAPIITDWHYVTGNKDEDLSRRSSAVTFFRIIKTAEKYLVRFPPDVIAFIRALLIIDMVCLRMSPSFNMVKAVRTFFEVFPMYRVREEKFHHATDLKSLHEVGLAGFDISPETLSVPRKRVTAERQLHAKELFVERLYVLADRYPELYNRIKKFKQ